jgi:predicted amidophosphoribosyltransferase
MKVNGEHALVHLPETAAELRTLLEEHGQEAHCPDCERTVALEASHCPTCGEGLSEWEHLPVRKKTK